MRGRRLKPKAMVLTGYGINCDYETSYACEVAGFQSKRIHLNDLLDSPETLNDYSLIVFPGGFTFGDDLGSGVAFSAKIKFSVLKDGKRLFDILTEHIEKGGLILGICNGFQILVRLGIIPACANRYGAQEVTLAPNKSGYFIDRWVNLIAEKESPNIFTRGLERLRLPVRHGEGRFIPLNDKTLNEIENHNHVALRYADKQFKTTQIFPMNPNGSTNAIAGICDSTGRAFGLMPHPEAAISIYQYPDWTRKGRNMQTEGDGLNIFKNAFDYLK